MCLHKVGGFTVLFGLSHPDSQTSMTNQMHVILKFDLSIPLASCNCIDFKQPEKCGKMAGG